MLSKLLTQRAICASRIALAESIRSSKTALDPIDVAFIKGAKAAMKLLNNRLAAEPAQSSMLTGDAVSITRVTRYTEFNKRDFERSIHDSTF
jgi:hypothetical protein